MSKFFFSLVKSKAFSGCHTYEVEMYFSSLHENAIELNFVIAYLQVRAMFSQSFQYLIIGTFPMNKNCKIRSIVDEFYFGFYLLWQKSSIQSEDQSWYFVAGLKPITFSRTMKSILLGCCKLINQSSKSSFLRLPCVARISDD